ncbi:MAG: 2-phospho-L-lactate guanylyltransferase [Microbacteriaceae bacterium]|nr:MAG: 2-phospho-L-lactate guanylyltransferase [Microbacteriaceae bacterium]
MNVLPRWSIVIPFKGAPHAKTRLAENFDSSTRAALAFALLTDTVLAVRAVPSVVRVVLVSNEPELLTTILDEPSAAPRMGGRPAGAELTIVADPADSGDGLNAAVSHGIRHARKLDDRAFTAALVGDVAALRPDDLAYALDEAVARFRAGSALAMVADRDGTGTTMITAAPGARIEPRFGLGSSAAHQAAGHVLLPVPGESSLRLDIDSAEDLRRAISLDPGLGAATRRVVARGPNG